MSDPPWRARLAEVQDLLLVAHDNDDVVRALITLTNLLADAWTQRDDHELLVAARQMVAALDQTNYDVFIGTPTDLLRLTDGRRALVEAIEKAEGRT